MDGLVEVSGMDVAQAVARVSQNLAATPEGESFEVTGDQSLLGVLTALQEAKWGEFDWFPLRDGPPEWRAQVRHAHAKAVARGLRELMGFDHQRCDHLYAECENAARAGDRARAEEFHNRFELGMLHHFRMEEEGFFPTFEQRTGMRQGPTMVMRMEHEQMRGLMRKMRQAMEAGDLDGLARAGGTMLMVMQQHNVKEEQMLYMMGEMHLGPVVDGMLREMQRMP